MPQGVVDPDELERFARDPGQFSRDLNGQLSQLRGGFARLGETWRDQQHQKFAREFEQMSRLLQQFGRTADEHAPLLMKKAALAREYLRHR